MIYEVHFIDDFQYHFSVVQMKLLWKILTFWENHEKN